MSEIISKELITDALLMYPQYHKVDECTGNIQYKPNSNVVHFEVNSNGMTHLNTYELAHKLKEWAFVYADFILQSAFVPKGSFTSSYCIAEKNFSYPTLKETFHADTEPEAIFKACQWILDNKDNQ